MNYIVHHHAKKKQKLVGDVEPCSIGEELTVIR